MIHVIDAARGLLALAALKHSVAAKGPDNAQRKMPAKRAKEKAARKARLQMSRGRK